MEHERPPSTNHPDCPSSQEPRITGNSGNTGNGLAGWGLQPLPPYKKSGNNWQRTPHFQHKGAAQPLGLGITVAGKNPVATIWKHQQRLEPTVYGTVAIVAAVAGVFEITGTLDYERAGRGVAMSLLSPLLDHMSPAFIGTEPEKAGKPMSRTHLALATPAERPPQFVTGPHANATTATPEWRQARDQYLSHVMVCSACYAPTGRHCTAGANLRASYDSTPMESNP